FLRRDRQIALVLAILIVHDDDDLPGADGVDRFFDRRERPGVLACALGDLQFFHLLKLPAASFGLHLETRSLQLGARSRLIQYVLYDPLPSLSIPPVPPPGRRISRSCRIPG